MIKSRNELTAEYRVKLDNFRKDNSCHGIEDEEYFDTFLMQLVDSIRRVEYFKVLLIRGINSPNYINPHHNSFHPIKGAVWHIQEDNVNEAVWLCFLFVHFGKNARTDWNLLKSVYGNLGRQPIWTWEEVTNNLDEFCLWVTTNEETLNNQGGFGNHKKYESLKPGHTDRAIYSFVDWIVKNDGFSNLVQNHFENAGEDRKLLFNLLYTEMKSTVHTFGRMAVFDFLTAVGKLDLAPTIPDKMYVAHATGPKPGAKLLFEGDRNASLSNKEIEDKVNEMSESLGLYFGMQVLEDALCNWQKSPDKYIKFTS